MVIFTVRGKAAETPERIVDRCESKKNKTKGVY
jgi:hypothetical protein